MSIFKIKFEFSSLVVGLMVFIAGFFALNPPTVKAETVISDDTAMSIVGPILLTDNMVSAQKRCLKDAGGSTLEDRLNKMFLVADGFAGWPRIVEDVNDWLVAGNNAESRSVGFLNIGMFNISDSVITDFGGPGNDIAVGGILEVSIPSSTLGILKGCIMEADGSRVIKNTLIQNGQDAATLDGYIIEYRGDPEEEDPSYDPVDVDPTVYGTGGAGLSGGSGGAAGTSQPKLFKYVYDAIDFLSLLIGVVLVGSTIFAGIQYTTAGADSGKVQKAKARLASNVLVLGLFIFSATILNWILPG